MHKIRFNCVYTPVGVGHPVYKYAGHPVYQNNERLEFLSVADGYSDAFPRCHCLGSTMSKIPCLPFVK